ncbi:MarR family winged helix-turn-helix transcriptional regulator [Priestia aryabhattai]|uniref:MarR family winged helix-turn-helix transcriptional regulator n=1 Tax=Priestia aryabhattai TaxID=412384 RepID=UPI003736A193
MAHARTLKALAEEGDLSVKELAIRTETTAAGVTQLINGLEQAGYVERLRSDHDRRVVTIRLTPTGLERHQNREKEIQRILSDTLSDYNAKQIEQSAEIIKRMIYVLDQL